MAKRIVSPLEFKGLAIREKILKVSEHPHRSAREVGELYGIKGARVFQYRALQRLRGQDGDCIQDAIDQKKLAFDRVVKAIQAIQPSDLRAIDKVQKRLLTERTNGRTIAQGHDPTHSASDGRRANSGRGRTRKS